MLKEGQFHLVSIELINGWRQCRLVLRCFQDGRLEAPPEPANEGA